ncbi:tetratricopeptide repeat protein [Kribbella sp. NPDC051718]|uniref:tetratricopeptide repeat protein n=1 Tax=Kribbella sp. NPDC051718 TaxID=3155168 RepID=UPI00344585B8
MAADHALSVAQLMKGFRRRAGLTQEALAERAQLSVRAIRTLEGGRRRYPRESTLHQLAAAFELSAAEQEQLAAAASRSRDEPSRTPRQLPPGLDDFTGRTKELDDLVRLLREAEVVAPSVVISAVGGMGGIGKTTLAVEAGRLAAEHYPDGQLYLNLGGGSQPVPVADALATVLAAMEVPPADDPSDVQAATNRYRTSIAGRRMLVLLDDAVSAEQVTPLIPGTSGSAVVITSRNQLTTVPGVRYLDLEVLSEVEAVALLGEVAGREQVQADPDAALDVVRLCGLLPLAVRIAGSHPSSQEVGGLAVLAGLLADGDKRLKVLSAPGRGVGASIGLSIQALGASGRAGDTACALALPVLAVLEGDRFPLRVAAAVLDLPLEETEDLLERLVDVHLLETPALQQYRMHDLVRDVGREQADLELTSAERDRIRRRELQCYFAMVWRSSELQPSKKHPVEAAGWSAGAEDVTDPRAVLAWLESELGNVLRVIRAAAGGDREERLIAARMAWGVHRLSLVRMQFAEARDALLAALDCDLAPEAEADRLWTALGQICLALGQHDRAEGYLRLALPLARARRDPMQVACCLVELGTVLVRTGAATEAVELAAEALALAPQVDFVLAESNANLVGGMAAGAIGDLAGQQAAFDAVLANHRARGAGDGPLMHLMYMGFSLAESGQYERGLAMLTGVLERSRVEGPVMAEFDALEHLGRAWWSFGDLPKAAEYLELALAIAVRHPGDNREAGIRHLLGSIEVEAGRPGLARPHWERAIALYDHVADPAADEVRNLLQALPTGRPA